MNFREKTIIIDECYFFCHHNKEDFSKSFKRTSEEIKINKLSSRQFVILLAVVVLIGAGIIFSLTWSKEKVVATVDGKSITKDELYDELVKAGGKTALNLLIENEVIDLELKKRNITITDDEVDLAVENTAYLYGGEEGLKASMLQSGLTEEMFRNNTKKLLSLKKIMSKEIEVTEEEIEQYFDENKERFFDMDERVEVHVILVDEEAEAESIIEELEADADFAELAEQYSEHNSAEAGGNVGFVTKDILPDALASATFALEIDEISEPIYTEAGYHIVKVTDKKEAKEATLDEARDIIKELILTEKTQKRYDSWFDEKLKEYNVKNKLK